jgi:hypothetical protein
MLKNLQHKYKGAAMQEYQFKGCTVRVHGSTDPEKLREATKNYLKKVERSKKLKAKKGA